MWSLRSRQSAGCFPCGHHPGVWSADEPPPPIGGGRPPSRGYCPACCWAVVELLLDDPALVVRDLQALLQIGDRVGRGAAEAQGVAEVVERVGVVDVGLAPGRGRPRPSAAAAARRGRACPAHQAEPGRRARRRRWHASRARRADGRSPPPGGLPLLLGWAGRRAVWRRGWSLSCVASGSGLWPSEAPRARKCCVLVGAGARCALVTVFCGDRDGCAG